MALEWGNADHDLIFNELNLANSSAIPLPSTLFLLGPGFLGVISYSRRRKMLQERLVRLINIICLVGKINKIPLELASGNFCFRI